MPETNHYTNPEESLISEAPVQHEALYLDRVLELQSEVHRTAQTAIEELPDRFDVLDKDGSFYTTKQKIYKNAARVHVNNYLKKLEPDAKVRRDLRKQLHVLVSTNPKELERQLAANPNLDSHSAAIEAEPAIYRPPDLTVEDAVVIEDITEPQAQPEAGTTEPDIKQLFEQVVGDQNQPELTRKLLAEHPELWPVTKVSARGRNFYVSQVTNGFTHEHVVLFTQFDSGTWVPRFLYKSQSDGGWRSAAFIDKDSVYYKGRNYTQDTKVADELLDYLETVKTVGRYHGMHLAHDYFTKEHLGNLITIATETRYVAPKELEHLRELMPGYKFVSKSRPNKPARDIFAEAEYIDGFIPDFTQGPLRSAVRKHTLLGDVTYETYRSSVADKPELEWVMAHDAKGRAWIDRIRIADCPITTYGTDQRIFVSGFLTNKPLEYSHQCEGLVEGRDAVPFMDGEFYTMYHDITPLLDNLLPIKQFRTARTIERRAA